jgi:carbamoyltransferase
MYVLGLKCQGHDTSAALISDANGKIDIVAISEACLNRLKHTNSYPLHSIKYCLDYFHLDNLDKMDIICIELHGGLESETSPFQYNIKKALHHEQHHDLDYKNNFLIEKYKFK